MSTKKSKSGLKRVGLATAVNMLINHAIDMNAKNADKLTADGYPGRQLRVAINEAKRHEDDKFSRGFRLTLRTACLALGDDPEAQGLKGLGPWDSTDDAYLTRLRHRIDGQNARAKPKPVANAHDGQAADEQAPPA